MYENIRQTAPSCCIRTRFHFSSQQITRVKKNTVAYPVRVVYKPSCASRTCVQTYIVESRRKFFVLFVVDEGAEGAFSE
jgi:hypothetical protein